MNISDYDRIHNISLDPNNDSLASAPPLTYAVNDALEEEREHREDGFEECGHLMGTRTNYSETTVVEEQADMEDVSEESGHLMRTRTDDNETIVLEQHIEACHPVCDGYTAPPPDYEDFMLMEYYRNKGLVCSGSQTIPDACLCSCHHEMGRRNTLQNGQTPASSYPLDTNGQSSSQNVPHSFNYGPQQTFQYGLGNYGIIQAAQNLTVHPNSNADRPNTASQTNGQDKTAKYCFLSLMTLIFIAGIIFGIIAALTY